ncbi:MAG TPA: hypothetical protein VHF92_02555 [Geodermatophilus sp.]|nr:hypothetical protein [Geodermatophilus sp.]
MKTRSDRSAIQIRERERMLAAADVGPTDQPGLVHSTMHVESGQLPVGTRRRLVDAVLDHPRVGEAERLLVTMPIGDTEMLDRVRERCEVVVTRAVGATKIVEARLDPTRGRSRP